MDISLLFKIAAIGILVAVLYQVLVRAGREDQAMMTTLAGLVIVLTLVIKRNKYIIYYSKDYVWFIGKTFIKKPKYKY